MTERHEAQERLRETVAVNERLVQELRAALQNVKTLSGMIPMCAWCRKIRSDAGYWKKVEDYLS